MKPWWFGFLPNMRYTMFENDAMGTVWMFEGCSVNVRVIPCDDLFNMIDLQAKSHTSMGNLRTAITAWLGTLKDSSDLNGYTVWKCEVRLNPGEMSAIITPPGHFVCMVPGSDTAKGTAVTVPFLSTGKMSERLIECVSRVLPTVRMNALATLLKVSLSHSDVLMR